MKKVGLADAGLVAETGFNSSPITKGVLFRAIKPAISKADKREIAKLISRMVFPKDLIYSKEHTWVRVDGNRATLGITDFAQSWIGKLVSIDLFEEGNEIGSQGLFGTLETSKVSFELYSPISGTIIKRNNQLAEKITLINKEPYGGGWMIVLSMKDVEDLVSLLDVNAYKEYLKNWVDAEGSNE